MKFKLLKLLTTSRKREKTRKLRFIGVDGGPSEERCPSLSWYVIVVELVEAGLDLWQWPSSSFFDVN